MPGIGKTTNEYQQAFGGLYDKTPKAVLAAVIFSWASREASAAGFTEGASREAIRNFRAEWQCLYENGIVRQKPPKEGA